MTRCQRGARVGGHRASASRRVTPLHRSTPFWQQRAFFRYGFLALILGVWEVLGPLVSPILFSYPSKIAVAFYRTDPQRRTALLRRREPADPVLRARLRDRGRRSARGADGALSSRSTGRSIFRSTRSMRRRWSRWCRCWCCGSASTCRPRSSWCFCSPCFRS